MGKTWGGGGGLNSAAQQGFLWKTGMHARHHGVVSTDDPLHDRPTVTTGFARVLNQPKTRARSSLGRVESCQRDGRDHELDTLCCEKLNMYCVLLSKGTQLSD